MTSTGLIVEFMPGAGPFDIPGDTYLELTALSGENATTPDHVSLDIVGDIDVRAEITPDSWRPPGHSILAARYVTTGDQRSWQFYLLEDGQLAFGWNADGTTTTRQFRQSLAAIPGISGRLWVRVTLDVDNGAGGHTISWWTSTDGSNWDQLGVTETQSGTTSLFASTAQLEVGTQDQAATVSAYGGRVHRVEVRDGIDGTVVAAPDFTAQAPGATSFADSTGKTWTVNGGEIIGYDWQPVPNRLLAAEWSWGRNGPFDRPTPGAATLEFANENRELDPDHTSGTFAGKLLPRVPFRLLSISSALDLAAGAGTATTADRAEFAVGDLDVRAQLAMDDWTPGGTGHTIAAQHNAGDIAWAFGVTADGRPELVFSTDGTATQTRTATTPTGFGDGTDHWVRVTLDVDNGAGGHTVTFLASDDGAAWDVLDTVTTLGVVAVHDSGAPLTIGGVLGLTGQIRYLEVRDGIDGTVVAAPDFTAQAPGATSFADSTGKTWTVNGTATVTLDQAHRNDEFYGFVQDGWIPDHRPPGVSTLTVPLTDMLGVLAAERLPDSVYANQVLGDAPRAYWRLDEHAGYQMADSSGHGNHGFLDNGQLGVDPLVVDGRAFTAAHVGDNRGRWSGQGLPVEPPATIEAWIRTPRDLAALKTIVAAQIDATLGALLWFRVAYNSDGAVNGELVIEFRGLGGGYTAKGHRRVDDDEPHHVVCTIGTTAAADIDLYVDGEVQTKTTLAGTNGGSWPGLLLWTIGNTTDNGSGDWGLDGVIDEVAIYDHALTAEQVAAHYQAGASGFDGDWSGDRVTRVLDIVGVPTDRRDIAQGDTTVGPADYAGQSALDYLGNLAESEQGHLYVAHWNGGKVTWRGRYSRITDTRSAGVLWEFSDADDPGALHYERDGLDIAPNGIDGIVNLVECRWRGGVVFARDDPSIKRYGPQSRTITTEAPTASAAEGAGRWLTNNYSQPQSRVRGFRLRPDADWRLRRAALDLRYSDRISLRRHPLEVGSPVTTDLHVERVAHSFDGGVGRTTAVRCSDAFLGDAWIWGTSTWGESTVWG